MLIVGAGTGGVAAALALANSGRRVILSSTCDWVGGQLTSQAVPPDEHPWIEWVGAPRSYRAFRDAVRQWYRDHGDLTESAQRNPHLNPGGGWVSRLCFDPQIGATILEEWLNHIPNLARIRGVPIEAAADADRVQSVTFRTDSGPIRVSAAFVLDATELGDLYPLSQTEYRIGAESRAETGEPHALDGPAEPLNIQGFTWCAAVSLADGDHTIPKPDEYEFWRNFEPENWCGRLLSPTYLHPSTNTTKTLPFLGEFSWFSYRKIVDPDIHNNPPEPATILNWPMNDYYLGSVIDVPESHAAEQFHRARQLTLSLIYYLQTEEGLRGLRLRPDLTGTPDGLAQEAYIREPRRLKALTTIAEQDVAANLHPGRAIAPPIERSAGVGAYRLDLHPAANGRPTLDMGALPFQLPLGALIPAKKHNLLAAGKAIGATHIANGCTRLHPIEWNVGESAALLADFCLSEGVSPHEVLDSEESYRSFRDLLWTHGVPTEWPELHAL